MRAQLACLMVVGISGCDRATHQTKLEPDTALEGPVVARSGSRPAARSDRQPDTRAETPVVVELFSSEGCSSCPAADGMLSELSAKQGVPGANVIVLELHVDYWNDLGWADPFSNAAFSARQRSYANAASRRGAFTPEAIVDGVASIVGSDGPALTSAVERAAARPHLDLSLSPRSDGSLDVAASGAPEVPSSYWLAITESGLISKVKAGENRGQTLRHAPVVRSLTRVGTVTTAPTHIALPTVQSQHDSLTAVVFVQQDEDLAIVGADTIALSRAGG